MPERDDRRRAESDLFGDAGEIRESYERLDEGAVRALHAVRVEDEVVAHPERIEAEALGQPRALHEQVLIRLQAEVGHEQAETGHDGLLVLKK